MRILFATDGSEGAQVALDMLLALPHRPEDRIDVVSVPVHQYVGAAIDGTGIFIAEVVKEEIDAARAAANAATVRLNARGIASVTHVVEGLAADAIGSTASKLRSDLIVVGSRGRGMIAGALLGSTARALARHSPIPVLVVRERRGAPRRILVATDGSSDSAAAISALASFPLPHQAEITVLHVTQRAPIEMPLGDLGDEVRAALEQHERANALEMLRLAAERLPSHATVRLEIEHGPVADRVLASAGAVGADLIVLGSRGMTLGRGFLQGSTADRVLSGARCSVLVARAPEPAVPVWREEEMLAATRG